jgi:hypothetical protein
MLVEAEVVRINQTPRQAQVVLAVALLVQLAQEVRRRLIQVVEAVVADTPEDIIRVVQADQA